MVLNFQAGGAAINQLSRAFGAQMEVRALDLDRPTADFTRAPAMDEAEFLQALQAGWQAVDPQADVLVTGEMGIGNTTSAAAVCAALFGGDAGDWVGRGTGIDDAGLSLKTQVVEAGIAFHSNSLDDGLEIPAPAWRARVGGDGGGDCPGTGRAYSGDPGRVHLRCRRGLSGAGRARSAGSRGSGSSERRGCAWQAFGKPEQNTPFVA